MTRLVPFLSRIPEGKSGAAPWESLGAAFALDALYLALGLLFAGKMFRTLKRRGYVTRYM